MLSFYSEQPWNPLFPDKFVYLPLILSLFRTSSNVLDAHYIYITDRLSSVCLYGLSRETTGWLCHWTSILNFLTSSWKSSGRNKDRSPEATRRNYSPLTCVSHLHGGFRWLPVVENTSNDSSEARPCGDANHRRRSSSLLWVSDDEAKHTIDMDKVFEIEEYCSRLRMLMGRQGYSMKCMPISSVITGLYGRSGFYILCSSHPYSA